MFKPIYKITDDDIKKVEQLNNRPNVSGGYGQAKLSAEQLKKWFDSYPDVVRKKVDNIIDAFTNGTGDYIRVNFDGEERCSLADLVNSIFDGNFADKLIVSFAENSEGESLIAALNGIKEELSKKIATDKIADGAVTKDKISDGAITTNKLADYSISSEKLKGNSVNANHLTNYSVKADHIMYYAVTADKLASNAVTTRSIEDGAIKTDKINKGAVTEAKLDDYVQTKLGKAYVDVSYDEKSGILKFTGNNSYVTKEIDLPLELIVSTGSYDDTSHQIVLTLANGNTIEIPVDDLVTELAGNALNSMRIETMFTASGTKKELYLELKNGNFFSVDLNALVPAASITESKIAKGAVTADKLYEFAVTESKIAEKNIYFKHLDEDLGKKVSEAVSNIEFDRLNQELFVERSSQDSYKIPLPFSSLTKRIEQLEGLTLKTIEDSSVAYEKVVPTGVGKCAVINKVGGTVPSKNLCPVDVEATYTLEDEMWDVTLNLGTYPAGKYYIRVFGDIYAYDAQIRFGDNMSPFHGEYNFILTKPTAVSVDYISANSAFGENDPMGYVYGSVHGVMICDASNGDLSDVPYEPYRGGIIKAKSIESYTMSSNNILPKEEDKKHILDGEGSYRISLGYLTAGQYYLSFEDNVEGLSEKTVNNEVKWWNQITFTLNEDKEVYLEFISEDWIDGNGVYLSGTVENIMLCRPWDSDTSYKPVVEQKLITSFDIPYAIRSREGYGSVGSYIDFDRKVWVDPDGVETDVAHLFPDYEDYLSIEVEPGGTIKFVNEEGAESPISSTVTYVTKV